MQSQSLSTRLTQWLEIITRLIKVVLWPVRYFSTLLFPSAELDGLSSAVTAKCAQQFVSYLQAIQQHRTKHTRENASSTISAASANNSTILVQDVWQASGFGALRQDALNQQSLLVIYLHSPLHGAAKNVANLLCHPEMLQFLQQDFVKAMGVSIHTAAGAQLQQLLQVTALPCLAVLHPQSSRAMQLLLNAQGPALLELLQIDSSHPNINRLIPLLRGAASQHMIVLAEQTARRLQREEEVELRRAQDEEYQAALRADQEREQRRQEELKKAEEEARAAAELEFANQQAEEEAVAKAQSLLRDEPVVGASNTAVIRFVLPTGMKLNRRFGSEETVAALKAFLFLHFRENGLPNVKNIGLSTNFPKKSYDENDEQTLQQAGLSPQAVLMVQDLDA